MGLDPASLQVYMNAHNNERDFIIILIRRHRISPILLNIVRKQDKLLSITTKDRFYSNTSRF